MSASPSVRHTVPVAQLAGVRVAAVGGFPALLVEGRRAEDWRHPRVISNLISVDDPQHFPLQDTRTGYWRYFILRGPKKHLSRRQLAGLGKLLLRVLRDNTRQPNQSRPRGIGGLQYNRKTRANEKISSRLQLQWARRMETTYRTVTIALWDEAKADGSAWTEFIRLHRAFRKGGLTGFFAEEPMQTHRDGRARAAFHRLIRNQRPRTGGDTANVAADFARLLRRRPKRSVVQICAGAGWNSFSSDAARRVFLARWLPWVLFRMPDQVSSYGDDGEDGDDPAARNPEFTEMQRKLARACLNLLTQGGARVRGKLSATQASQLVRLLSAAIRRGRHFEEPLEAPPLPPGQSIQTLFPGLRLDAFARLVRSTGPR